MEKEELLGMTMPCCQQHAHSQCFKTWIIEEHRRLLDSESHYWGAYDETAHCGYCRTPFPYEKLYYLCLETKQHGQSIRSTECCKTIIHTNCADILQETLNTLTFEFSLECGKIISCKSLWHKL
jgi:hypothetical protein